MPRFFLPPPAPPPLLLSLTTTMPTAEVSLLRCLPPFLRCLTSAAEVRCSSPAQRVGSPPCALCPFCLFCLLLIERVGGSSLALSHSSRREPREREGKSVALDGNELFPLLFVDFARDGGRARWCYPFFALIVWFDTLRQTNGRDRCTISCNDGQKKKRGTATHSEEKEICLGK